MTEHILHTNRKTLALSTPAIMGVLNVTPDSFSDGGRFVHIDTALAHVEQMNQWGVDIIDVGAESTRPYASDVSDKEELVRLTPIIKEIRNHFPNLLLSIDTSSPAVIEQMVDLGVDIWNDVRGLRRDGAVEMASRLALPVVIMHSRGEPSNMNNLTNYSNVVEDVITELSHHINRAMNAGVQRENIIIDVGMGFAKNYSHHVALMANLDKIITHFNLPMLFGVSRKRFLGEILNNFEPMTQHQPTDRDMIGMVAHLLAVQKGANIVRVHDVASMAQALKIWQIINTNNQKHI